MSLEELRDRISKKSKGTHVSVMSDSEITKHSINIPTPAYDLNRILSGSLFKGLPARSVSLFVGPETCIDKGSYVPFETWSRDGTRRINHKGGTIERLYRRFHRIQDNESDYFWKDMDDKVYYAKSINEENGIIRNLIVDVVHTGEKECFELITEQGYSLICTDEHKYYVGNDVYIPLKDLSVGDIVYIHNNTRFTKTNSDYENKHKDVLVKYYPNNRTKVVNGCKYYRAIRSHLAVECVYNNMNLDEFISFLNNRSQDEINNLKFIEDGLHVHHINKISDDDRYENLEVITPDEHLRRHANENHNNLRFIAVEDVVKSIKYVGMRDTYDIKCLSPYNNYITNNIVTHNSGKSSLACLMLAEAQRNGYTPIIIDSEGAWTNEFVKRWGMDPESILYIYDMWVDSIMVTLGNILDSDDTKLAIVLDSIGALESKKLMDDALEGDVKADQGQLQRKIKRMLKMLQDISVKKASIVMCTGHYYGKPGTYGGVEDIGGGHYVKLFPQVIVSLKKSKMMDGNKKVIGNALKAITLKNRYYPAFEEAIIEIDYRKGINSYAGILDLAMEAGLAERKGAWYIINDEKYQGAINAEAGLREDKDLLRKLDKWLETTGYSTINNNIAEAVKLMEEEEKDVIKEELEEDEELNKELGINGNNRKITSKITKGG
jgi:recombination protein RecA